eukprot:440528-Prorocentrum_minimum.AAC.2
MTGERSHLVGDERYERGDDDGDPLHGGRRELEAQALAPPGGHQDQAVVAAHSGVDDLALVGAEPFQPKAPA